VVGPARPACSPSGLRGAHHGHRLLYQSTAPLGLATAWRWAHIVRRREERTAVSLLVYLTGLRLYRHYSLNYTIDMCCGPEVLTNSTLDQFPHWMGFCGLLSLCCGPEISWKICAVAYYALV
jgi:hypothetical protein